MPITPQSRSSKGRPGGMEARPDSKGLIKRPRQNEKWEKKAQGISCYGYCPSQEGVRGRGKKIEPGFPGSSIKGKINNES